MKALPLTTKQQAAYVARLFSSHDYAINAQVLDLNERVIGDLAFLDGQINFQTGDAIRRTASLTVSDPAGALDMTGATTFSGTSVWLDRLIRITHSIKVPGVGISGDLVSVVGFIGPPSTFSRSGAEVTVELQDKAALANRGTKPLTVPKGTNAITAIRSILAKTTGEFRFALGTTSRRLSKPYSVGWADETSPWAIASQIAKSELGLTLYYTTDGYAALRRTPSTPSLTVPFVTDLANTSVDFTGLYNWVQVTGKKSTTTTKNKAGVTTTKTSQPLATAQVSGTNPLAPAKLGRKGIPRYLPLVESDSKLTTLAQVQNAAKRDLGEDDKLAGTPQLTCVPFFHADPDDLVRFEAPEGTVVLRLSTASIPLGTGGEMTVGSTRWVSAPPGVKASARIVRTKKVTRPKKKAKK